MSAPIRLTVTEEHAGERADKFVTSQVPEATRSQVAARAAEGGLLVEGRAVKASFTVREGQEVEYTPPDAPDTDRLIPEDIPLTVLYADEHIVVVDKPAGLVVYPAAGHASGTLMNALAFRYGPLTAPGGPLRPGVVHRLDKDTSGVMVVALTFDAYHALVEAFRERSLERTYRALVLGALPEDEGSIEAHIGRSVTDRKRMSTQTKRGKPALTHWRVVESYAGATLVEARLATGRTHQIRVHFSTIGHPVLGDVVYGKQTHLQRGTRKIPFPRQMLHAATLGFAHPVTGAALSFSAPVPPDMAAAIELLRA
jgi:23S rRNA pseudouridine1911/1915/1917 synthase